MSDDNTVQFPTPDETESKQQMTLLPNEMMQLQNLRGKVRQLLEQVGQLEVQKAQKIAVMSQFESQAQQVMMAAAERLGIPKGTEWQAGPDGQVTLIEAPTEPIEG